MLEVSNSWSWRSPSRNRKFTLKSEAEYNKTQFIWQPIAESGGLLLEMQGKNDVFGLAPQFLSFDLKWICLLCIGVGWRFFTASFIVNENIPYSFISHPKHNALCPNPTSVFPGSKPPSHASNWTMIENKLNEEFLRWDRGSVTPTIHSGTYRKECVRRKNQSAV